MGSAYSLVGAGFEKPADFLGISIKDAAWSKGALISFSSQANYS